MSAKDIIAAALEYEENFEKFQVSVKELSEEERDEVKKLFNQVTKDDKLGDVLFDTESSFDDVKSRIHSLDDEDQQKFIGAML